MAAAGCAPPSYVRAEYRYQHGLIYVLPGIEGPSVLNRDIAIGLDEGGVRSAIEIYDWTYGIPGSTVMNLVDIERNRREAARLASRIVDYRDRYPGKPVHLLGHSGGAGVAVLALEALPPGRQIDMAILLAPALSPEFDLSIALRRTRHGIQNYFSDKDIGFLKLGTTIFGTADRSHGFSAGAVGFRLPPEASNPTREIYREKLRQVEWDPRLKRVGASGSHMGWASETFARDYLAPLIVRNEAEARARKLAEDRTIRTNDPPPLHLKNVGQPPPAAIR